MSPRLSVSFTSHGYRANLHLGAAATDSGNEGAAIGYGTANQKLLFRNLIDFDSAIKIEDISYLLLKNEDIHYSWE